MQVPPALVTGRVRYTCLRFRYADASQNSFDRWRLPPFGDLGIVVSREWCVVRCRREGTYFLADCTEVPVQNERFSGQYIYVLFIVGAFNILLLAHGLESGQV
jgi:hypothetical protein